MKFIPLQLQGAHTIELEPFADQRGLFARLFCSQEFQKINHHQHIVQINHSINYKKGALRGMHYQKAPKAEIKILRCVHGAVYDVIIDIRKDSPTFLKWHGEILSGENMRMMYVPKGFAHGFQTLETNSELLYFHTEFYNPEFEGAISYDEPQVSIKWPKDVTEISERDKHHPYLDNDFAGLDI